MNREQPVVARCARRRGRRRRGGRRARAAAAPSSPSGRTTGCRSRPSRPGPRPASRLADGVEGEVLVPGGAVCSEEGIEEARDRHGGQSMAVPPAEISTDLLTPLGAYLRLRGEGRASFLLESVEQGRLGRHSFIGSGSRLVSFEEAEALDEPVVGYLAYDHVARARADRAAARSRPDLPRAASSSRTRSSASTTAAARRRCSPAIADEIARAARAGACATMNTRSARRRATDSALPRRRRSTRPACGGSRSYIRAGDAFQVVLSQRAERPTSASALELYRALRRVNPSPYLFLLELDGLALVGSSPETLVKCEDGRASLNPIAGTTAARRGRRRAAARLREGPRRARDARRPRPQRPLARLPGRHRARRALPRAGALLARHAPRLGGRRASCATASTPFDLLRACFPAGTVSGAPKVRAMQIVSELEGYRRGPYAGAVGYALPGRDARHVHRDPDDRARGRRRAAPGGRGDRGRLRPGRRAPRVPEQARRARGRDRPGGGGVLLLMSSTTTTRSPTTSCTSSRSSAPRCVVLRNDAITRRRGRGARARRTSSSPPAPAGRPTRASRSS